MSILNKEKKGITSKWILGLIFLMAVSIFLYSVYKLLSFDQEYKAGKDEYKDLMNHVNKAVSEDGNSTSANNNAKQIINFEELKSINSDMVGWIYFEAGDINYPIVKGKDNSYYLTHTFKKNQNICGSIFMDYLNNPCFTDLHTFIYGHNMKNGSMFGSLNRYESIDFYKKNPYFWVYTPYAVYKYEIFSCYFTNEESIGYKRLFTDREDYKRFIEAIREKAMYNTGVTVSEDDLVLSLSTCAYRGGNNRFIVHAKRTKL